MATTTIYLRSALSTVSRGTNTANKAGSNVAWRARAISSDVSTASNSTLTITSIAGPTSGIEPGATPWPEWVSPPFAADTSFTTANFSFGMCAHESNGTANATICVKVERLDKNLAVASTIVDSSYVTEVGTSNGLRTWTGAATATTVYKGERLRITVYFDDCTTLTMGASRTLTFTYDGTAANTGNSYVTLPIAVQFQSETATELWLQPADPPASGGFGTSVACNGDGSVIVGGTPNDPGSGSNRGSATFRYGPGYGSVSTVAGPFVNNTLLGTSVSMSRDGVWAALSHHGEDYNGTGDGRVGIARWYSESYVEWTLPSPSDFGTNYNYSRGLCMAGNGARVICGAPGNANGGTARGKAYIITRSGANADYWGDAAVTLTASDAADNDNFGFACAMNYDGTIVAVGAYNKSTATGKVYVYSGANWATETIITASDAAVGDWFGYSVALSYDGTTLIVGAPKEDGAGTDRGKVYMYYGASWGTEVSKTATSPVNSDFFGWSVACSDDGTIVWVGAPGNGTAGKVAKLSGTLWGTTTDYVATDTITTGSFGSGVACTHNGAVGIVGAKGQAAGKGKVYVVQQVGIDRPQIFMTDTASDIVDQGTLEKEAWTTRGTG